MSNLLEAGVNRFFVFLNVCPEVITPLVWLLILLGVNTTRIPTQPLVPYRHKTWFPPPKNFEVPPIQWDLKQVHQSIKGDKFIDLWQPCCCQFAFVVSGVSNACIEGMMKLIVCSGDIFVAFTETNFFTKTSGMKNWVQWERWERNVLKKVQKWTHENTNQD